MIPQPRIETERLVLRPLRHADAGLMSLYCSDARVARMTRNIPHPMPPGSAEAYVERVMRGQASEMAWAIDHRASRDGEAGEGELVGVVILKDKGEIGYWVGAPFWSTGFATEAVEAVVAQVFAERRFARLTAEVFQDNPASAKVLTKAGFRYVGEGEGWSVARDAKVAVWHYEITPPAEPGAPAA